jgi:hypothetical protein
MKQDALKLADKLDGLNSCEPVIIKACEDMIRKLVAELDKVKANPFGDDYVVICKRCGDELNIKYEEQKND